MRKGILAFLLVTILVHAPWRLGLLIAHSVIAPPGRTHLTTGDDQYWQALALEDRLIALGWEVQYASDMNFRGVQAYGVTDWKHHTITIDDHLHWNQRFAVLAHEGGHVFARQWLNEEQSEVFAESVAYLVVNRDMFEHARYVGRFKADAVIVALIEWRSIYRAASVLEDR